MGKVGSVLGKVGEGVAVATLGNNTLSEIPGTHQYKEREEGLERQKEHEDAQTGNIEAQTAASRAKTEPFLGDPNFPLYAQWESEKDDLQKANPGMTEGDAEHQMTVDWMKRGLLKTPIQDRAAQATQSGLKEGTPEYQKWVLTGTLPEDRQAGEVHPIVSGENLYLPPEPGSTDLRPLTTPATAPPDLGTVPVGPQLFNPPAEGYGRVPARAPVKEKTEKENKAVAGTVGGSPAWGVQTEKGWVDPQTGASLPGFKPPPNYAEQPPPEFSPVVVIGSDGTPQTLGFNKRTNQVSAPNIQGGGTMLAPGQVGAQQYQATVIENAGSNLLNDIKANKGKFGNVGAIINSAFLGTPLSDPASSRLAAEIASFAALQPRLHGFRGQEAMREFEKMMGGLPNNPDSLAEAINGMLKTAGAVQGRVGDKVAGGPNVIGSDEHFNEWLKNRGK